MTDVIGFFIRKYLIIIHFKNQIILKYPQK